MNTLCFPQYGVNIISDSILASNAMLQSHPSLVRACVAATTKGFDAQAHPDAAIADLTQLFPSAHLDPAVAKPQSQNALTLLHTPATHGKPLGGSGSGTRPCSGFSQTPTGPRPCDNRLADASLGTADLLRGPQHPKGAHKG